VTPRRNSGEFDAVDTYVRQADAAAVASLAAQLKIEQLLERTLRQAGYLPESAPFREDSDR
jgi:hypothetical protein